MQDFLVKQKTEREQKRDKRMKSGASWASTGPPAPRMPLGPAMSLPLSGCVGVHHTGRVHPGANSQWLLLHASRGPSRQVVLDPEHPRGPGGPAGAAAPPGGQNSSRKNKQKKVLEEEEEGRSLQNDGRLDDLVCLQRHQNLRKWPHAQKRREEEEERRRRRGEKEFEGKVSRKKMSAGGSDPSVLISCTTFNQFLFNLTEQIKRGKFPENVQKIIFIWRNRRTWKRRGSGKKSLEGEKMNGGMESSPNGETSAETRSQKSFIISSKKEEQRGAECRPLMEG